MDYESPEFVKLYKSFSKYYYQISVIIELNALGLVKDEKSILEIYTQLTKTLITARMYINSLPKKRSNSGYKLMEAKMFELDSRLSSNLKRKLRIAV